jgi:hypothetical protein
MHPRYKLLCLALPLGLTLGALAQDGPVKRFDFEADKPGDPPQGFSFGRTGKGSPGK